jgi:hypothetical protein
MFKLFYYKRISPQSSVHHKKMNKKDLIPVPYIIFATGQKAKSCELQWNKTNNLFLFTYLKKSRQPHAHNN